MLDGFIYAYFDENFSRDRLKMIKIAISFSFKKNNFYYMILYKTIMRIKFKKEIVVNILTIESKFLVIEGI